MLTLRTFTAKILRLNEILVQWSIDSTDDDISKFRFTLGRSNSPGGPFERIAQDFVNEFRFLDETEQMKSNWRKFYYRITITDVRGGAPLESPVASVVGDPDLFLIEIRRRHDLYLRRFVGVPAGLLIARTFGQRCGQCWDQVKSRVSQSSCHTCFAPGTLIRTASGFRAIETIKIGDEVLAQDGLFHRVRHLHVNPYEGRLMKIQTTTTTREIYVTPDHPFMALQGGHRKDFKCRPCSPKCNLEIERYKRKLESRPNVRMIKSGRWWARSQIGGSRDVGREALGTFSARDEAVTAVLEHRKRANLGHHMAWTPLQELKKGSWVATKWPRITRDLEEISIPPEFLGKAPQWRNGSTTFNVSEEFLWAIGMYIAEGSSGSREITFSLHREEVEFQDRLRAFFAEHGFGVTIRKGSENGVRVTISSTSLAEWFPALLGRKCYLKQIPEVLMYLPNHKAKALIRGIYDGDGSKACHQIVQTSEILALQMTEILHRIGEQPLVSRQISATLTPKGNRRRIAYRVNWADSNHHVNRDGRWKFENDLLTRVKSCDPMEIQYSGKVYNLEVEECPSYVVQNLLVHNCFSTGFAGGYFSQINFMLGTNPGPELVALLEQGEQQPHQTNYWTGSYPEISPRDIIVEFREQKRWRVATLGKTERLRVRSRQIMSVKEINRNDVEYEIPITTWEPPPEVFAGFMPPEGSGLL